MIDKIISGGQTGADVAGLIWAKSKGLATGGWMPNGFRTDEGPRPEYAALYNVVETAAQGYKLRTRMNASNSDGTLIFGRPWSPGCALTQRYCVEYRKPYLIIEWCKNIHLNPETGILVPWLTENKISVLNIAGNREKSNPGIQNALIEYLNGELNV